MDDAFPLRLKDSCIVSARVEQSMQTATFELEDEDSTQRFAAALAACLPVSATVVLSGTLGAGKTRFVQAFAEACGVPPGEVTSPTFVLCQHYEGRRLIHHLDVYRLTSADEFIDLGGWELMQDKAVCMIEWGERLRQLLPADRLQITLLIVSDVARRATVIAHGERMQEVLTRLYKEFS